ncbi:hypothetical protein XPR_1519 [Xanthomonas arboricola pv. pruni MAFF 301420]|uniref:Glycosyltransferase family 28 N-terminal domain-containing protein n=2 Tax=Xanthomonas arboricola pv. pruni TaxID=69929 RepID=W4SG03_9XANT|nr:glucosyltransferase [Xanthomonas arboricola pv. pruni str. MAFF 311562]GAE54884.1 hypothetical protein XPR_1519 [Xanthomonas arboricola pv. pruni MAFF 301420]GAE59336.1 hypothetical protein XPN_1242 [Xanthomonas arboricola pv. pruni MAFF 301427]
MPDSCFNAGRQRPVLIATLGTHGDVRPIIALGRGLQERGYPVRVLTSANFEALIRANGLDFFPLSGDHQKLLQGHPDVARCAVAGAASGAPCVRSCWSGRATGPSRAAWPVPMPG